MFVAPYVGAWIETPFKPVIRMGVLSHPTWVRGLKQLFLRQIPHAILSHPTWVRGLKLITLLTLRMFLWSHPTWVRGLKLLSVVLILS